MLMDLSAILPLVLLAATCQSTEDVADPTASSTAQWQCRNDLEISCDAEHCEAADSFTPMSVTVDDAGSMSVCVYTGCWEGTGTVAQSARFVVLTGHDLPFSTAAEAAGTQADIVIAIDKADDVAILKAGSFAQPLRCETL